MIPNAKSKRLTTKEHILNGFVYRQEVFLKTFLPHLEEWGKIATQREEEYYDALVENHDEFLRELAEILLVSIYHWYEDELKSVLGMLKNTPKREQIRRFYIDDLKNAFKQIGMPLSTLKSWNQVEIIRKLANSLKHNGRYSPSAEFLRAIQLPLIPICDLDNKPTTYYGTLTSGSIQNALARRLKISSSAFKQDKQRALLEASMRHIQELLKDLVVRTPSTAFRRGSSKPVSLTTFAV